MKNLIKSIVWSCVAMLIGTRAMAQGAPAAFEKLGSFTGRGSTRGSIIGPGPNGTQRLYTIYLYLSSMDIVGFTPGVAEPKIWKHSEGGAFALELGPDNRIYIGTYYQGHVLRLDPQTDKLEDLGPAIPGETYVWKFAIGPDKQIYGSTFPNAKLFRLEPATGKITDLGRMDAREKYLRAIAATTDGWIYGAVGPEKSNLIAYHIATKELRGLLPEAERIPGFPVLMHAADGFAYGSVGGKSFRLRDGAATLIDAKEMPKSTPSNRLQNGEVFDNPNTYAGRNLPIFRVASGPDGKIYGSSVLPEYLLRFDPKDSKLETMGLIPGAQAYGLLAAHDKLYITSYTDATLQIYDPAKPFKPGKTRTNNPSNYGQTAPNQGRPLDLTLGGDGKIYIADVPTYGYYGGALAWHDPKTDQVEHVPTPIENQSLTAICALPENRILIGTSTSGGSGTTEKKAKEAVLFEWDTKTRAVTWQGVPFPEVQDISNLVVGGDGLVYGSAGGSVLFVFDPKTRAVLGQTKLAQGNVLRAGLHTLKDGRIIALAGASALTVRFVGGQFKIEEIARYDAPLSAGKAELDGFFYAAADDQLLRFRIPTKP